MLRTHSILNNGNTPIFKSKIYPSSYTDCSEYNCPVYSNIHCKEYSKGKEVLVEALKTKPILTSTLRKCTLLW